MDDWQTRLSLGPKLDFGPSLDDWQRRRPELGYRLAPRPVDAAHSRPDGLGWTLDLTNQLPQPSFGAATGAYTPPLASETGLVPLR